MEWAYEDVVRWTIRNLNIDNIIAARLRGTFSSVRRREISSPLFTGYHLRRKCATRFYCIRGLSQLISFYLSIYMASSCVLDASITESSPRSHNSFATPAYLSLERAFFQPNLRHKSFVWSVV